MARIRTIKPEFFRHEELFEAEQASGLPLRIAFAGLWTVADREGRFRWRPRIIKLDVMPFDEVDFSAVLDELAEWGFIVRYEVGGEKFAHIPKWSKHQHVNQREPDSEIPAPDEASARTCKNIPARVEGEGEGKGKEGEGERADALPTPEPEALSKKASRLPPDWQPSDESIDYALGKGIPRDKIPEEVEGFRDHWNSKSGKDAAKLDWPAAWRTWVKRSCDWKSYKPPAPGGRPAEAVEFICTHDARWPVLADRYAREHGKPPPTMSGVGGPGRHFPASWVSGAPIKRSEVAA